MSGSNMEKIADRVEPVPSALVPEVRSAGKHAFLELYIVFVDLSGNSGLSGMDRVLGGPWAAANWPLLHTWLCCPWVPQALRKSMGSVELFKEEFRAAQRLRSTEGIFIPEVRHSRVPCGAVCLWLLAMSGCRWIRYRWFQLLFSTVVVCNDCRWCAPRTHQSLLPMVSPRIQHPRMCFQRACSGHCRASHWALGISISHQQLGPSHPCAVSCSCGQRGGYEGTAKLAP